MSGGDFLGSAITAVKHFFDITSYPMTTVKSKIDGKEYRVRDMADKQRAADLLADLRMRMNKLKLHLESTFPDKPQVQRLSRNYHDDPSRIIEAAPDAEFTSYSVNKGESVHFCLRQREGQNESLVNGDVMMFVALHEMSHMITESVGHDDQFWNNFAWLLKEAEKIGVYTYQDFKAHPVAYCGIKITDQPTYDPSKDGTDFSGKTA
jgi:WLM domain